MSPWPTPSKSSVAYCDDDQQAMTNDDEPFRDQPATSSGPTSPSDIQPWFIFSCATPCPSTTTIIWLAAAPSVRSISSGRRVRSSTRAATCMSWSLEKSRNSSHRSNALLVSSGITQEPPGSNTDFRRPPLARREGACVRASDAVVEFFPDAPAALLALVSLMAITPSS